MDAKDVIIQLKHKTQKLLTEYAPGLESLWDPVKNEKILRPGMPIRPGMAVWWQGECGHEWQTDITQMVRIAKRGGCLCPYCSERLLLPGFNDLATKRPDIAKLWHPTLNGKTLPTGIFPNTAGYFWWRCDKGHEFQASLSNMDKRTKNGGDPCGICANSVWKQYLPQTQNAERKPVSRRKILKTPTSTPTPIPTSVTDIQGEVVDVHSEPSIPEPKPILRPSVFSIEKNVTPECLPNPVDRAESVELARTISTEKYFSTGYPDLVQYLHPKNNRKSVPLAETMKVSKLEWLWRCKKGHVWTETAIIAERRLHSEGQVCPTCVFQCRNPLSVIHPDIAALWDHETNEDLGPEMITSRSTLAVWWMGTCGHKWNARISWTVDHFQESKGLCPRCYDALNKPEQPKRVKVPAFWNEEKAPMSYCEWRPQKNYRDGFWKPPCGHEWVGLYQEFVDTFPKGGNGCPYCAGIRLYPKKYLSPQGPLDLKTVWHPTKNGTISPEEVPLYDSRQIWFTDKCSHEWVDFPMYVAADYKAGKVLCPYCRKDPRSNRTVLGLSRLWHPDKNEGLDPGTISVRSKQKVWWLGECGHEWKDCVSTTADLWLHGKPICPFCQRGRSPYNFQNQYPELAKLWHPTRNGALHPNEISVGATIKIWLQCEKGHEWETWTSNLKARYKANGPESLCPYCNGKKVIPGEDIQSLYPDVAARWDREKNDYGSDMAFPDSPKQVWWKCELGHEWKSSCKGVVNKAKVGQESCPYCAGKIFLSGFNSLAIVRPDIAKLWHPTKNGDLTPDDVPYHAYQKVWWLGECGHEWETHVSTLIRSRDKGYPGCPYCRRNRLHRGVNDLATVAPELAKMFHPTKNAPLTASDVARYSMKSVWWCCENGHEWENKVGAVFRKGISACPICYPHIRKGAKFVGLKNLHPEIASWWHPERSRDIALDEARVRDNRTIVWWKCPHCGADFEKNICQQVRWPRCPRCKAWAVPPKIRTTRAASKQNNT